MRRHLQVFVAENFPDVSELDSSVLSRRSSVEFPYVSSDDPAQADAYRPRACLETCKVHLAVDRNFGIGATELIGHAVYF